MRTCRALGIPVFVLLLAHGCRQPDESKFTIAAGQYRFKVLDYPTNECWPEAGNDHFAVPHAHLDRVRLLEARVVGRVAIAQEVQHLVLRADPAPAGLVDGLANHCDKFTLDVALSPARLQFDGPPAFEPRAGDSRRGRPIVGAAEGRIRVGSDNVSLVPSDTVSGCGGFIDTYLQGTALACPRCDVADAMENPSGGLRGALNDVADSLGSQIFTPLFEETLKERRPHIGPDARQGVVLFIGQDGRLHAVHQPPFAIPEPQAVSHAP